MLALALTLQLLGPPALPGPEPQLVPPLRLELAGPPASLAADPAVAPGPEAASPPALAGPSPWRRVAQHGLSAGGLLLGDAVALTIFTLGYIVLVGELYSGESGRDAETLLMAGVVTWLFVPPALGVSGARIAGAPAGRGAAAYWLGVLLHLGTSVAVAAAADRGHGDLAGAAFLAGELALTPYVIVRVLEGGAPGLAPPAPGLPSPAERALPPR